MRRKRLWMATAAAGATAALLAVLFTQVIGQEGSSTEVKAPPTVEETIAELPHIQEAIARGEAVNIVPPTPADPTVKPFLHGDFRIVPAGFVGTLTHTKVAELPADTGPITEDIATTKKSPLWVEPGFIPAGYELVAAGSLPDTWGVNTGIQATYRAADGSEFTISRWLVSELPMDFPVVLGPEVSFPVLKDGRYAIALDFIDDKGIPSTYTYRALRAFDPSTNVITQLEVLPRILVDVYIASELSGGDVLLKIMEGLR